LYVDVQAFDDPSECLNRINGKLDESESRKKKMLFTKLEGI
jgi:hypothetical protein